MKKLIVASIFALFSIICYTQEVQQNPITEEQIIKNLTNKINETQIVVDAYFFTVASKNYNGLFSLCSRTLQSNLKTSASIKDFLDTFPNLQKFRTYEQTDFYIKEDFVILQEDVIDSEGRVYLFFFKFIIEDGLWKIDTLIIKRTDNQAI